MGLRVLTTGSSGFLLRNTLPDYDWEIIPYEYGTNYNNIDLIVHFGGPSDALDFQNKIGMAISMINVTLKLVTESLHNDCKMIYASSLGAVFLENEYDIYKRSMEQYIETMVSDHLILRIPRVYGSDRDKGLMRQIRECKIKDEDWGKPIQYIEIEDFKVWFSEILNKNGIKCYNKMMWNRTIKQIKELYCEF